MIEVQNLHKQYGDLVAVEDISFQVKPGSIYGLLGPNGAGKTTTISMMCGLLRPNRGKVSIDGIDVWSRPLEAKRLLGFVPQEVVLYANLSARQNLRFWGGMYGMPRAKLKQRVDEVLEMVELADRGNEKAQQFSGGMKRRLNMAIGLIHEPKVLLLDEPTVGIDPHAREHLLGVVRRLADAGTTVVYTSHYLDEVERLCDDIMIIDHGKVLASGTLEELRKLVGHGRVLVLQGDMKAERLETALKDLEGAKVVTADGEKAMISVEGNTTVPELLGRLHDNNIEMTEMSIREPDLHGVFIALTGRELRD